MRYTLPLAHTFIRNIHDVSFIAAFPRSGSTWLRTMICNVVYPDTNSNPKIYNRVIPGVSLKNINLVKNVPYPRIIFTHSKKFSNLNKAVYLIRDGRDVMVSYYHFSTTRRNIKISFDTWLSAYLKGYFGTRWDEHILSWLGEGHQQPNNTIHIVKFENLKKHTTEEVSTIMKFFGIRASQNRITAAVEMASLEKGRKWEEKYIGKYEDPNASFYRGGKTGQWQNYFSSRLMSDFMKVSEPAMKLAGYL